MSVLTPEQLAGFCLAAGFQGQAAAYAVAVALAESGGNTGVRHVNSDTWRSVDRGVFQLNSHWHPEVTDAQAFDPAGACAAAYRISRAGKDWHEWSTWRSGAASAELSRASLAVARPSNVTGATASATGGAISAQNAGIWGWLTPFPGDVGGPLGAAVPPIAGAIDAAGSIAKTLAALASGYVKLYLWVSNPHHWARVLMAIGGGAAVIVGLVMLSQADVGGPVGDAATVAATGVQRAHKAATRAVKSRPVAKAAAPAKAAKSGAAKAAGRARTVAKAAAVAA